MFELDVVPLRGGKFGIAVRLQIRVETFLLATTSGLTLAFTYLLMQEVSERLYAEGQSPWRKADHSNLNSAEFKKVLSTLQKSLQSSALLYTGVKFTVNPYE
jgi:hypothetical protein